MSGSRIEIQSLRRGIRLLRAINQSDGAHPRELAGAVGINRSTAYRLLDTLVAAGYVGKDAHDGRYRTLAAARRLSVAFEDAAWHPDILVPAIDALGTEICWPLGLSTRTADDDLIVRHVTDETSPLVDRRVPPGSRLPLLETAAGRLHLAMMDASASEALLHAAGAASIGHRTMLRAIRRDGFAQVHIPDRHVIMTALPILRNGELFAALTLRIMDQAMTPDRAAGSATL